MHLFTTILLLAISPLTFCQMGDDWFTTIDDQYQDVILPCNVTDIPSGYFPELWMLPDLTNIEKNFSDGRINVLDNGYRLEIRNASVYDFGLYHCMTLNDMGDWYLLKTGLNVKGPYFQDVWPQYETGTIVGISACFGFILAALLIMGVSAHQWQAPEGWYEDEMEERAKSGGIEEHAYTNPAFTSDKPTPAGAKGYVEVKDNLDTLKSAGVTSDVKPRQVANGKAGSDVRENGGFEMKGQKPEEQASHDIITEL